MSAEEFHKHKPKEIKPQGVGSTLDADKVDGLHASELGGGGAHDILSASHGDTLAAAVVAGDIIIGNATPKWSRLAKGIDGKVLKLVSGLPAWAALAVADLSDHTKTVHDALAIDHTSLTNKGTNTHNSIDAFLASKAVAYGLCDLDVLVKVPAARMPSASVSITRTLTFSVVGTLAVLVSAAPALLVDGTLTIIKVKIVVKTKPTGAGSAVTVDVNKNGTTIFTTQDGRPSITVAGGLAIDDSSTPDVTALAENDILTIDVDAIGGTVAGADLTVEVVCTQAVTVTFT